MNKELLVSKLLFVIVVKRGMRPADRSTDPFTAELIVGKALRFLSGLGLLLVASWVLSAAAAQTGRHIYLYNGN